MKADFAGRRPAPPQLTSADKNQVTLGWRPAMPAAPLAANLRRFGSHKTASGM
jgi:hypothetical protein